MNLYPTSLSRWCLRLLCRVATYLPALAGCDFTARSTRIGPLALELTTTSNGFRCFSCERQGDSLKLYQTERGLSFKEALDSLQNLTGISNTKPIKKRRASDLLKRGGDS